MRVFVLGAGASVHAGYPLTKDLGPRLLDHIEQSAGPTNYPFWPERAALEKFGSATDIEDLVTTLEASEKPGDVLAGLREALCHYFGTIRVNGARLYNRFATDVVRAGDVIITFNYDVSLERELRAAKKWEIRDGYGFQIELPDLPRSPVKILKLHGSTNWIDSLFGGARGGDIGAFDPAVGALGIRPVIVPKEFESLGYPSARDPRFKGGGADRSGSLVLPSRKKKYYLATSVNHRERETFWDMLWGQAEAALGQADEITVIGYSLPAADGRARKLVLKGSNRNAALAICCGSQNKRLNDEFALEGFPRDTISTSFERFEDFLAQELVAMT